MRDWTAFVGLAPVTAPYDLSRIVHMLSRPVPPAYRPPPEPQASWATLKAGQRLVSRTGMSLSGSEFPTGTEWTVTSTDSQGAWLTPSTLVDTKPVDATLVGALRWSDREWQATFERVKGRKRK